MIKTGTDLLKEYLKAFSKALADLSLQLGKIFGKHTVTSKDVLFRKIRIALATFLITLMFLFIRGYFNVSYNNLLAWGILYAFLGVFALVTTYFVLRPFNSHSFFTVGVYPALYAFLGALTIHSIFLFDLARISYIFVFALLVVWYFFSLLAIFLMTNILNVNMFYKIPLAKLAEGVLRIFALLVHVMIGFLLYIIIKQAEFFNIFSIIMVAFNIFLLVFFWNTIYRYFTRDFSYTSVGFGFIVLSFLVIVSLYLFLFIPNIFLIFLFLIVFLLVFIELFIEHARQD